MSARCVHVWPNGERCYMKATRGEHCGHHVPGFQERIAPLKWEGRRKAEVRRAAMLLERMEHDA